MKTNNLLKQHFIDVVLKKERIGIGILSGTSIDGIDVGLYRFKKSIEEIEFKTYPISKNIRQKILCGLSNQATPELLCELNFIVAKIFSNAVITFKKEHRIENIDFIASHGQTFWHIPKQKNKTTSTLQLGDGNTIANLTKTITISDFRTSEISLGGEGAPLVPSFDFYFLQHQTKNRLILNIGGISNVTILPAIKKNVHKNKIIFFDCGPGNVLIDLAARKFFNKPYDNNGQYASIGKASMEIILHLMQHVYFQKKPPKSTGRELFSMDYFHEAIKTCLKKNLLPQDVLATLSMYTAFSIHHQYKKFSVVSVDEVIVSGGGAKNGFLMRCLQSVFTEAKVINTNNVMNHSTKCFTDKSKEAALFAWLGNMCLNFDSASMKTDAILGKISIPYQL